MNSRALLLSLTAAAALAACAARHDTATDIPAAPASHDTSAASPMTVNPDPAAAAQAARPPKPPGDPQSDRSMPPGPVN